MKKLILLVSLIGATNAFSSSSPLPPFTEFSKTSDLASPEKLWATNYYTELRSNNSYGQLFRDRSESPLEVEGEKVGLSDKFFCYAAMEGSVALKFKSGKTVTFNYNGRGRRQLDCSIYFGGRFGSSGEVKFKVAYSKWGEGEQERGYALVPYRTIAVDSRVIPFGSVIYIPKARGTKIKLPTGETFKHDGYFFAGDHGGAIKGNHIDVFTGNFKKHPFPWIRSSSSKTFSSYLVRDKKIIEGMTKIHMQRY
ncbi:MAG: 3D (Asp-Asp-Asp) domain-containing protein [Bacteriovoracaceae bacterium]|jgi:3D (Asp-Asp-Asp) domain-containing protein